MADIVADVLINARASDVFRGVSTPTGLDAWWTKTSAGRAGQGEEFQLDFGPGYEWRARVTKCEPDAAFELELFDSHPDWDGTRVGFRLAPQEGKTQLSFYHTGWPVANEHWRVSCYCWPIYLRLLRRNIEHGELVPYEKRLDV
jgi:uncharacterized protein YndB with AHSA1/START domain